MIGMSLSRKLIKKYPEYGYSALNAIEKYITAQVKNHNHGRQFLYYEIERDLGYPIKWLQLAINGGHNGFMLSEEYMETIKV